MTDSRHRVEIPTALAGQRLDTALAHLLPEHSRSRIAQWIKAGRVTAHGVPVRARDKACGGEILRIAQGQPPEGEHVDETQAPGNTGHWTPEHGVGLRTVYEDDDLIVVDKPAGLVVHPGAGVPHGTLANGLLGAFPELANVPRAGLVHRLDKDTTGLLVVARSPRAHTRLVEDIAARRIGREYEALVHGKVPGPGTVDAPIGRHRTVRTRMTVRTDGRHAVTHYRVLRHFDRSSHLRLRLQSGRTHQIRVHLRHAGFPIVGDPTYGRRQERPPLVLHRQALHAATLALSHPITGASLRFDSAVPSDMHDLLAALGAALGANRQ